TWPLAVAMSVGRAKKARYASEFPSSRRIGATTRSYGRGRPTAYGLRLQLAVQDLVGDLDHLAAGLHRRLLDEVEGLGLAQLVLVHQLALGPVDDLARLELLLEALVLLVERLQLLEAAERDLERGDQLALLERLDEIRQRAGVAGLLDQVALAERGEDQHRGLPLVGDLAGRAEAVEA